MENECEALPGVAYPGVRDNRSTLNTKTGYDDMMKVCLLVICLLTTCAVCRNDKCAGVPTVSRAVCVPESLDCEVFV